MIRQILVDLKKRYVLLQREMHDLKTIKTDMTEIACDAYEIEGVGNLFVMEMDAMQGAMKMESSVITPNVKDLSFCNIDIVKTSESDLCLFEMYKTSLHEEDLSAFETIKEAYKDLPEYDGGEHWYDSMRLSSSIGKKGKAILPEAERMLEECVTVYLKLLEEASECNSDAKKESIREYAERLIKEGGMAVDGLIRMIGIEKTKELIRNYMFDIGEQE